MTKHAVFDVEVGHVVLLVSNPAATVRLITAEIKFQFKKRFKRECIWSLMIRYRALLENIGTPTKRTKMTEMNLMFFFIYLI